MILFVDRYLSNSDATLSKISVDGKFVCYGLEDEYRTIKVQGETRIPAGTYKVKVRPEGGFHTKYKERFANIHKGMLHVANVPGFEYILIHCGNTDEDTMGCLLVGTGKIDTGELKITGSSDAYVKLYTMVIEEALKDNLSITYVDNDLKK